MRSTRSIGTVALIAIAAVLMVGIGAVAAKGPGQGSRGAFVLYSADDGIAQSFGLRNPGGDQATIQVAKDQLKDANATAVGEHHWQCIESSLAWFCTGVITLDNAAQTGAGSITVAGLFEGFNGESLAITGGTGAYAGARGTVVLTLEGDRFARTVTLLP